MKIPDSNLTLYNGTQDFDFHIPSIKDFEHLYNWTQDIYLIETQKKVQILSIIFYSITFILGIPGNGLVIWIAGFKMKKVSAVWFLNLAIADFICCVILPLKIAFWALIFKRDFPYLLCQVSTGILHITMCVSANFLAAMSIDRCISIMWPFWSKIHKTPKCARITSVIIWGLSLILSVPHVTFNHRTSDVSECAGKNHFSRYSSHMNNMLITRCVTMFVIPFTIILVCYCLIFFKLLKVKRQNKSQRPYRIITAVVTCFFICWFPYYIWPLITMPNEWFYIDNTVYASFVCLAYFNSCINPILYVFIGQDFKESLMLSLPSRLERALKEISN